LFITTCIEKHCTPPLSIIWPQNRNLLSIYKPDSEIPYAYKKKTCSLTIDILCVNNILRISDVNGSNDCASSIFFVLPLLAQTKVKCFPVCFHFHFNSKKWLRFHYL